MFLKSEKDEKMRSYIIAVGLAIFNILWYITLSKIYVMLGHDMKYATYLSLFTWLLTLPFTFWTLFYWLQKKLR